MKNHELGMFYAHISVIDAAYIDSTGWIVGESLNPSVEIFGKLTEGERVIADFSSCKKHMKEVIDDREYGFDHKLWIGHEAAANAEWGDGRAAVVTPHVHIQIPSNGIRPLPCTINNGSGLDDALTAALDGYVTSQLCSRWPEMYHGLNRVEFSRMIHFDTPHQAVAGVPFNYTHGLAKSTSWGCNLITHGHRSYLYLLDENGNPMWGQPILAHDIARHLDSKYIANHEHVDFQDDKTRVAYQSLARGPMQLDLVSEFANDHLVVIEDEPTIENIAMYLVARYEVELRDAKVGALYISEGSNKGAFVRLLPATKN